MDYTLKPSLEHTALVKIATTLWKQDDIRALMPKFYFPSVGNERRKKWQKIEDKVIEKVPQLPLPEPLKEEILGFIKPVGLQIFKWMEYHNCNFGIDLPNELCWTPQGTLDKKKTAEMIIKDERLDNTVRYKLACIYCLEDDIPKLWNKIPEKCRKPFYSEVDPIRVKQQELVVLWTYNIKGEADKLDNMIEEKWVTKCSLYQYAFEYAAAGGNKAATEYFLQKLTPREREESLVRSAGYAANSRCSSDFNRSDFPKEHYADVLCFLLSQMDEEQRIEVFKRRAYKVLKCLLDWPWQSLFMETTNRMWDFLSGENCDLLLRIIVDKVMEGHKDCNYQKFFAEVWKQSPDACKRYVIGSCSSGGVLLFNLFRIKDEENVRLILKDATVKEKEKIIFYFMGKDICEKLINSNKWDSLKFFVLECIPSKDKIIEFNQEFKARIGRRHRGGVSKKEKNRWRKAFQFIEDLAQENNKKRSVEEGDSSQAKRFCSIELEETHSMKE